MKKIFISFAIFILTVTNCFAATINTDAMLKYNQGIDYYKIGRYNAAVDSFRSAVHLDPNYIDAYYNLGSVLEYLEQYDAALVVFKQIIVRKPSDYDSVYKAAWLSYKLGRIKRAKSYLSIIPPNCARSSDAQKLASKLNVALHTSQKIISLQPKNTITPTSGIYKNISAPTGITADKLGNIYVAEFNTNTIIKLTPDNKKIVFVNDPKINGPIGLAIDKSQNMYIANYNKDNILKISPLGEISILISNIKKPYYLYLRENMLFISSQGSNSVLRYKLPN